MLSFSFFELVDKNFIFMSNRFDSLILITWFRYIPFLIHNHVQTTNFQRFHLIFQPQNSFFFSIQRKKQNCIKQSGPRLFNQDGFCVSECSKGHHPNNNNLICIEYHKIIYFCNISPSYNLHNNLISMGRSCSNDPFTPPTNQLQLFGTSINIFLKLLSTNFVNKYF